MHQCAEVKFKDLSCNCARHAYACTASLAVVAAHRPLDGAGNLPKKILLHAALEPASAADRRLALCHRTARPSGATPFCSGIFLVIRLVRGHS